MKFPSLVKPRSGITSAGPFSIRYCDWPYDAAGGGDDWDYAVFEGRDASGVPAGSLLLFVGDLRGHGKNARILANELGAVKLFRASVSKQIATGRFDLTTLRDSMDAQISRISSVTVQATFALFVPQTDGCTLTYTPDTAQVARNSSPPDVEWWLATTAHLLGLDYLSHGLTEADIGTVNEPFPSSGEFVLGTDGLFEQRIVNRTQLKHTLIAKLLGYASNLPLFGQVCREWKQAADRTKEQDDDTLIVSVRRSTEDDLLVFRVLSGDVNAQREFYDKYRQLVAMIVKKIVGGFHDDDDHLIAPGVSASDVIQDIWLHLFRTLSKWNGGIMYSWVQQIAINYLYSLIRKWKGKKLGLGEVQGPDDIEAVESTRLEFGAEEYEELLRLREECNAFVRTLPKERHRFLELLRKGVSRDEICATLDISRKTYFNWQGDLRKTIFAKLCIPCPEGLQPGECLRAILLLLWPDDSD